MNWGPWWLKGAKADHPWLKKKKKRYQLLSVDNGYAYYYCSIPDMSAGVNSGGPVSAGEGNYFCNLYSYC